MVTCELAGKERQKRRNERILAQKDKVMYPNTI